MKRIYTCTIEVPDTFPTNAAVIAFAQDVATNIGGTLTNVMYKESLVELVERETVLGNFGVL